MKRKIPTQKNEFIERLRTSMEEVGISQTRLAKKAELSPTAISKYLKGINLPRTEVLERLAKALNVDVFWLQGYNTDKTKTKTNIVRRSDDSDGDIYMREMALEYLELCEKIKDLEGYELIYFNERFDQLHTIDNDDWNLLLWFNGLNNHGKKSF